MTADGLLFETTSTPGHLAPTPQRLERLLSKQPLEELYEVEDQPFARGKYATVKRCRERSSGRQWAAKFLKKRRRAQELRNEALHEVAVLDAAARCSRLVSLHQVFETKTEMVLVLELAPGGELQMVLDKDEVPEERQVARLMKQILDGIAFLHSLNVAHLDIKPQNLVLTGEFPECDVKLCDFGISRYISRGADIREILGTPDYVAPEVLNYEPISLATDMWSVGVLLYVLLTGCSPFGGDSKQETFCNISRCRLDFPDDLFEDVSEEARDLMRKLMVKDPSERLTITECLEHPWFSAHESPEIMPALALKKPTTPILNEEKLTSSSINLENSSELTRGIITDENKKSSTEQKSSSNTSKPSSSSSSSPSSSTLTSTSTLSNTETKSTASRAVSSHTDNVYTKSKTLSMPMRIGLSPDRRDTFKKNMDSLAQRFSTSTEIVIIEPSSTQQRRATATHTMPAGEIFKCTPVFILGEEQQCSDSGSDTVSEISTDSSSDRSSIYSDDSLDFILYGKTQSRASFPFVGADTDRWEQKHPRIWPRECSGVVSKALSRFSSEPGTGSKSSGRTTTTMMTATTTTTTSSSSKNNGNNNGNNVRGRTSLEAMRERGGELVVIREPVRAGRYTRYSEVQCESVQARIRRFQVHGAS